MNKFKLILISLLLLLIPELLFGTDSTNILASDLKYFVPLGNDRTADYNKLKNRIIGQYGDYRNSNVQGHKHSGLDIEGNFNEPVYSIGKGMVINIFRDFPHKTIYILHNESVGVPFYSVYIHVEDIQINVGDRVTKDTVIARIFNQEELTSAIFGTPPHLHFEIRHNINDKGEATFKSMSIPELNKYCIDPLKFYKKSLINP